MIHAPTFYLAARYQRRIELKQYAAQLSGLGIVTTSRWLSGKHEAEDQDNSAPSCEMARWSFQDLADIRKASYFVLFTERNKDLQLGRGGRFVEFGYALGMNKQVYIVGPEEQNIFTHIKHNRCKQFDNFTMLHRQLKLMMGVK